MGLYTHTRTGITKALPSINADSEECLAPGGCEAFALPGNYSKAKQTHEANWLEPVETDVEIIESAHCRLCGMHCSICVNCFNASPHAQNGRKNIPFGDCFYNDVEEEGSDDGNNRRTPLPQGVPKPEMPNTILRAVELTGQRRSVVLQKNAGVTDKSLVGTAGRLTIQRSCP